MTVGDWALWALMVLPVVALTGVGFLVRAFVDGGGGALEDLGAAA